MDELKWPVIKCEDCDYDLREATVKATEKGLDPSGRLVWTDFCPKCGHGYQVGLRTEPAKPLPEDESIPIIQYIKDEDLKPTPQPPEGSDVDPEGQLIEPSEPVAESQPEPEAIRPPGEGEYFCTKCASNHKETSKVGKRHLKYRE